MNENNNNAPQSHAQPAVLFLTLTAQDLNNSQEILQKARQNPGSYIKLDFSKLSNEITDSNALNEKIYPFIKDLPKDVAGRVAACDFSTLPIEEAVVTIVSYTLPLLVSINFSTCRHITDGSIVRLLEKRPSLQQIDLQGCEKISDITLQALMKYGKQLNTLKVSHTEISGERVLAFYKKAPDSLKCLEVTGCVTEDELVQLCTQRMHWIFGEQPPMGKPLVTFISKVVLELVIAKTRGLHGTKLDGKDIPSKSKEEVLLFIQRGLNLWFCDNSDFSLHEILKDKEALEAIADFAMTFAINKDQNKSYISIPDIEKLQKIGKGSRLEQFVKAISAPLGGLKYTLDGEKRRKLEARKASNAEQPVTSPSLQKQLTASTAEHTHIAEHTTESQEFSPATIVVNVVYPPRECGLSNISFNGALPSATAIGQSHISSGEEKDMGSQLHIPQDALVPSFTQEQFSSLSAEEQLNASTKTNPVKAVGATNALTKIPSSDSPTLLTAPPTPPQKKGFLSRFVKSKTVQPEKQNDVIQPDSSSQTQTREPFSQINVQTPVSPTDSIKIEVPTVSRPRAETHPSKADTLNGAQGITRVTLEEARKRIPKPEDVQRENGGKNFIEKALLKSGKKQDTISNLHNALN